MTNTQIYSGLWQLHGAVSPSQIPKAFTMARLSLYEAVAIAVASFREDDVTPSNPMTEFTVSVYRNPNGA